MKFSTSIFLSIITVLLCSCGGSSGTAGTNSELLKPKYLFLQEAQDGRLAKIGPDTYQLILTGVSQQTIYFAERPFTDAGTMPTSEFIGWFDWEPAPPNAALVLEEGETNQDTLIVKLSSPIYDYESQELSYIVQITQNYSGEALSSFGPSADDSIPENFGQVSLFIDDSEVDTCGSAFAFGTPVQAGRTTKARIEYISPGFSIQASQDGKNWQTKQVEYSSGTGPNSHQPMMVYLVFLDGTELMASADSCLVDADGKVRRADGLLVDMQLMGFEGPDKTIATVSIGEYNGGIHSLAIDRDISPPGWFYVANGVVVTEYLWQGIVER